MHKFDIRTVIWWTLEIVCGGVGLFCAVMVIVALAVGEAMLAVRFALVTFIWGALFVYFLQFHHYIYIPWRDGWPERHR